MEAIGVNEAELRDQVILALCGVLIAFFIISPIGGYYLHRAARRLLPEQDLFALLAMAFVMFMVSFAVFLGVLLRLASGLDTLLLVELSLLGALIVTGVTALSVKMYLRRSAAHLSTEDQGFSVWGEDRRKRPKNYRKR